MITATAASFVTFQGLYCVSNTLGKFLVMSHRSPWKTGLSLFYGCGNSREAKCLPWSWVMNVTSVGVPHPSLLLSKGLRSSQPPSQTQCTEMTPEGTHSRCWAYHTKYLEYLWSWTALYFYLRRVIHLEACSICSQRCWHLCEQSHPSRERGGAGSPLPTVRVWVAHLFCLFITQCIHPALTIREKDTRRVRDVSCQKGPVHKLLMLQRLVAGYNKHLKPNPRDFHSQNHCCSNWLVPECQLHWDVLHRKCESKCRKTPTELCTMIPWIIHKRLAYSLGFCKKKKKFFSFSS